MNIDTKIVNKILARWIQKKKAFIWGIDRKSVV